MHGKLSSALIIGIVAAITAIALVTNAEAMSRVPTWCRSHLCSCREVCISADCKLVCRPAPSRYPKAARQASGKPGNSNVPVSGEKSENPDRSRTGPRHPVDIGSRLKPNHRQ